MILLTGSTGFIGSYLRPILESRGLDFTRFTGDLADTATYPELDPDTIIHLAAKVDKKYWDSPLMGTINVSATEELMKRYPNAKMVYISSADIETASSTPYAITKKEAEDQVLKNPKNLSIRPPSIIGPNDPHRKLFPNLFRSELLGQDCPVNEGPAIEYMTIDDLCEQILDALPTATGILRLHGVKLTNFEVRDKVQLACKIAAGNENPPEPCPPLIQQLVKYAKSWRP